MARRLAHFRDPYLEMQIEELLKVINPIAEINVSTAVTSVSFTGLDGNAHGGYILEAEIYNPTASDSFYKMYVNSDQVDGNYVNTYLSGSIAGPSASSGAGSRILYAEGGVRSYCHVNISQSIGGFVFWLSNIFRSNDVTIQWGGRKTNAVSNITQLDIVAAIANSIGVGSRFRLFRRL